MDVREVAQRGPWATVANDAEGVKNGREAAARARQRATLDPT